MTAIWFRYSLGTTIGKQIDDTLDPQHSIPDEFMAVVSEYYIHGKDYFSKMYREFLPAETTNALYNFVRDDVFQGTEYVEFPIK